MAAASIADYQVSPKLDAPATPERVLMAVERLKALAAGGWSRGLMPRLAAYEDFAEDTGTAGFVLVRVVEAKGSTPRDTDAWMLVSATGSFSTIGGGRLELEAIDQARAVLAGAEAAPLALPLGPAIGQCCGGHVTLSFEIIPPARFGEVEAMVKAEDAGDPEVWLFGGGHVGRALAAALLLLPVRVHVAETREGRTGADTAGRRATSDRPAREPRFRHSARCRRDRADPRPCAGFPDRLGSARARRSRPGRHDRPPTPSA